MNFDDGIRIWINGQLKVDMWSYNAKEAYFSHYMVAGQWYNIKIDYFDGSGFSVLEFKWDDGVWSEGIYFSAFKPVPTDKLRAY